MYENQNPTADDTADDNAQPVATPEQVTAVTVADAPVRTVEELANRITELEEERDRNAVLIQNYRDRIQTLSYAQISGDDNRLTEFWKEAQQLAEENNYCEQFDRLAEALGGPTRNVDVCVDFTVSVTLEVTASGWGTITRAALEDGDADGIEPSNDSVRDALYEAVRNYNYNIEDYSIDSIEVD